MGLFEDYQDFLKQKQASIPTVEPDGPLGDMVPIRQPKPMTPVDDAYAKIVEENRQKALANRGFLGNVGADIAGGVLGAGEALVRTAQLLPSVDDTLPPDQLPTSRALEGIKGIRERNPYLFAENPQEGISGAVHGGIQSVVQSLTASSPAIAAGALAGSAIGGPVGAGIGAVAGFALGGGTTFAADTLSKTLEDADARGISRTQSEPVAIRKAIYEGGFEALSDVVTGFSAGLLKPLTAVGKTALTQGIKPMLTDSLRKIAGRVGATMAGEVSTEMMTAGLQAEEDRSIGLGDQTFWSAATDAIGPSMVASLIFSAIGGAGLHKQRKAITAALEEPWAPKEQRLAAVQYVAQELQGIDEGIAGTWLKTATQAVAQGRTISMDENLVDLHERISNLEKIKDASPAAAKNLEALNIELRQRMHAGVESAEIPTDPEDLQGERDYYAALLNRANLDDEDRKSIESRIQTLDNALGSEDSYADAQARVSGQGAPLTETEELPNVDARIERLIESRRKVEKAIFNARQTETDPEKAKIIQQKAQNVLAKIDERVSSLRGHQDEMTSRIALGDQAPEEVKAAATMTNAGEMNTRRTRVDELSPAPAQLPAPEPRGALPAPPDRKQLPAPGPSTQDLDTRTANIQKNIKIYQAQSRRASTPEQKARLKALIQKGQVQLKAIQAQRAKADTAKPIQVEPGETVGPSTNVADLPQFTEYELDAIERGDMRIDDNGMVLTGQENVPPSALGSGPPNNPTPTAKEIPDGQEGQTETLLTQERPEAQTVVPGQGTTVQPVVTQKTLTGEAQPALSVTDETQSDQPQASTPEVGQPKSDQAPNFQSMVDEAARWKGAATNADRLLQERGASAKEHLQHSKETTKADLDKHLMEKFGIDEVTARSVSNQLTAANVPADATAKVEDYAGASWADRALGRPAKAQTESGRTVVPDIEKLSTHEAYWNGLTPDQKLELSKKVKWVEADRNWLNADEQKDFTPKSHSKSAWSKLSYTARREISLVIEKERASQPSEAPSPEKTTSQDATQGEISTGSIRSDVHVGQPPQNAQNEPQTEDVEIQDYTGEKVYTLEEIPFEMRDFFSSGGSFKNIVQARKYISQRMHQPNPLTGSTMTKMIDEAIEFGLVLASRRVVGEGKRNGKTSEEIFNNLVELHSRQPNLSVRTSTSVLNQAYSTPLPIAFMASELAGIDRKTTVYEPTAGNGALLIGSNPRFVAANELDPLRAENLESLGVEQQNLTRNDATQFYPNDKFDVVIANPPFGKMPTANGGASKIFTINRQYSTDQIDHAIALKALQVLKSNGKAVLIIGGKKGTDQTRLLKYRPQKQRAFFHSLYNAYNVVDHFTISGDLYSKQGAGWPIDIIVIDGLGKSSQPLPSVVVPPMYNTFDSLIDKLKGKRDVRTSTKVQEDVDTGNTGDGSANTRNDTGPEGSPGAEGRGPLPDSSGSTSGVDAESGGPGGVGPQGTPLDTGGTRDRSPGSTSVEEQDKAGESTGGSNATDTSTRGGTPTRVPGESDRSRPGRNEQSAGEDRGNVTGGMGPVGSTGVQGEQSGVKGNVEEEIKGMTESDIDGLLDDVFGKDEAPAIPKPSSPAPPMAPKTTTEPKAPPAPQPTAKDLIKKVGIDAIEGIQEAFDGLSDLFTPKNTLGMGLPFDEDTYAKAKPHFEKAWELAKSAGYTLKQLAEHMLQKFGESIKPYLKRFLVEQSQKANDQPEDKQKQEDAGSKETENQVYYTPTSKMQGLDTLVPKNLLEPIKNALADLEGKMGDLDDFVLERIGFKDKDHLRKSLSAEQVDAVALALSNFDKGSSFIIGDQTGIGKGRVVASIIKYAIKQGRVPIFVTAQSNLYSDMIRDLYAVGQPVKPFITNSGLKGKDAIELPDGSLLKTGESAKNTAKMQQKINEQSLGSYNVIFTTYSQMQTIRGGQRTIRNDFLEHFAPGSVIIFDESHLAGGGTPKIGPGGQQLLDRALFARNIASLAHSVMFSSATFAKRPEVMSLYATTDIRHAVNDINDLAGIVQNGGIPLQQVLSSMLTQAGQYIRRERSYKGVDFLSSVVPVDTAKANNAALAMDLVRQFDVMKNIAVSQIDDDLGGDGGNILPDGSRGSAGMQSTNFTSIMHNLINQMLLAFKVNAAVQETMASIERGEKVVITVANTMGSFIEEHVQDNNLRPGDAVNLSFNALIQRYLEKSRWVTAGDAYGIKTVRRLTDEELGPEATAFFNNTMDRIRGMDFTGIPVSPIDAMKSQLSEKDVKVGEITGRNHTIAYASDGTAKYLKRPPKEVSKAGVVRTVNAYNSGDLDVLVINQAGATGLSIHASVDFKDQRQRHMIIAQPEANIDTFMQMLGRIFRTGQVKLPKYTLLMSDIPAEKRPGAVLSKKLASLNANTTASRKTDVGAKDTPDFINSIGDQVAADFLWDQSELATRIGIRSRLQVAEDGMSYEPEDLMRKFTGYIPLLPVEEQEKVYAQLIEMYDDTIKRMTDMGENPLEARDLPLDARTLSSTEIFSVSQLGQQVESPFMEPAYVEKVDIRNIGKPYTSTEVMDILRDQVGMKEAEDLDQIQLEGDIINARLSDKLREDFDRYLEEELSKFKPEDVDKRDTRRVALTATLNNVESYLNTYSPGSEVRLVNNSSGEMFYGIVQSIEKRGEAKNPAAPGTWRVTILVAHPAKKLVIPLSKLIIGELRNRLSFTRVHGITPYGYSVEQLFDRRQQEGREERFMVTGNVFSGYGVVNAGQITHYTDDKGNRKLGVLLPRSYNPAQALASLDVPFSSTDQVIEFVTSKTGERGIAKTSDKILYIQAESFEFKLSTPLARSKGGMYFLNPAIRRITGDFVSLGGRMVARVSENRARQVIDLLIGDGTRFIADSFKSEARQITGSRVGVEDQQSGNTSFALSRKKSLGMKVQSIRDHIGAITKGFSSLPEIVVVQNQSELPQAVSHSNKLISGVYYKGKVYLVAENLDSVDHAERIFLHETVGHHGMEALLGGRFKAFLKEVVALYGKDGLRGISELYGFNLDTQAGLLNAAKEKIARMAESGERPSFLKRLYAAIREKLRAIGFKVKLTDNDIKALLARAQDKLRSGGNAAFSVSRVNEFAQSAGMALNRAKQNILDNRKFKKWFGDSVVTVDGKPGGEPLVVYHGTSRAFSSFSMEEQGSNFGDYEGNFPRDGFWFTSDPANADWYSAVSARHKEGQGRQTYPAYLKVKNPYVLPAEDFADEGEAAVPDIYDLKDQGYDGLVVPIAEWGADVWTNDNAVPVVKYTHYVAFSPEQIKSVYNTGSFDPDNPDISYSLVDTIKSETDTLTKTISDTYKGRTEGDLFQRVFKSPEWWKHPTLKRLFEIAGIERPERVHQIVHQSLRLNEVLAPLSELKKTDPASYEKVGAALIEMDESGIKWDNWKDKGGNSHVGYRARKSPNLSAKEIAAIDSVRTMLDQALELQMGKIQEVIDMLRAGGIQPGSVIVDNTDGHKLSIIGMYREMGDLRGSYFPRKREPGDWAVLSEKDGVKYREHFRTRWQANRVSKRYHDEGRQSISEPIEVQREPESVYQSLNVLDMQKFVEQALRRMGAKAEVTEPGDPSTFDDYLDMRYEAEFGEENPIKNIEVLLKKELFGEIATLLKERGFRSSRIRRQEGPAVKGYIEDPIRSVGMYATSMAGGIAKSEAASNMIKAVKDGLDERKDSKRYDLAKEYIAEQLKNPDRVDRIIAAAKSIVSFKYLGFSPKTAAVNVTSLLTTAPAAIHQYAMGGHGAWTRVGAYLKGAMADYGNVMRGKTLPNAEEQAFMDHLKGSADLEQYTRDAMSHLAGAYGSGWANVMQKSMWMFQKTEEWVRGSTMLAAYRAAREDGKTHDQAMAIAKDTSNKAHGTYSKASQPMIAMGSNPTAKIAQMGYTYMKFAHNYVQLLTDLGANKKNWKAFSFALISPAILAGAGGTVLTPVLIGVVKAVMRAFGDDRDPEKMINDTLRESVGPSAETAYRHGLFGLLGMDISGSISIGLEPPKTLADLTGPFGGVAGQLGQAGRFIATGQLQKAGEELAPTFAANISKSIRELSGATTRRGNRVWNENGTPYIPTGAETIGKLAGFRSSRRGTVEERRYEVEQEERNFAKRKEQIFERYRAYLNDPKRDSGDFKDLMEDVSSYNLNVRQSGRAGIIPFITLSSLRRLVTSWKRPSKNEMASIRQAQ